MASRGNYPSRSISPSDGQDQVEKRSTGFPRKSSVTSVSSNISKIPTASWFSRGKHNRTEARPSNLAKAVHPEQRVNTSRTRTGFAAPRSELEGRTAIQMPKSRGLAVSSPSSPGSISKSQTEPRQRNTLRRKAPSRDQRGQYARTEPSVLSHDPLNQAGRFDTASTPGRTADPKSESVFGVALPPASTSTSFLPSSGSVNPDQATSSSRMALYNKRREPEMLSTQNLPPPTPSFAHSSGSSTRRSESPSSFSRTSTPTSMSSHSPAMSYPAKSPLKIRQPSPTRSRPPVTRWRLGRQGDTEADDRGLPALRESVTSSSSSSTIKGTERTDNNRSRQATYRLSPPPPSPPLGRSSAQHTRAQVVGTQETQQARYRDPVAQRAKNRQAFGAGGLVSPPPRPSREGTPRLDDHIEPSPVIQTNISRLATTGLKRRESFDKADVKKILPYSNRSGLKRAPSNGSYTSIMPSRLPSPSTGSTAQPFAVPPVSQKTDLPRLHTASPIEPNIVSARSVKDPSPESASSVKSFTRLGLFSRRTRPPLDSFNAEAADRAAKKGPAAGTGHEGYGKYARRGRSGSVSTNASRGRSTSTSGASSSIGRNTTSRRSSTTSRGEAEMDEFLRERLTPVYLSGGGNFDSRVRGIDSSRTSSKESLPRSVAKDIRFVGGEPLALQPLFACATMSAESEEKRRLRHESRTLPSGQNFRSGNSDTQGGTYDYEPDKGLPTLAARRSLHKSQFLKNFESVKIPTPINTRVPAPSLMDSRDDGPTSAMNCKDTAFSDEISEGREGNWLKPRKKEKRSSSPNKRSFFQRAIESPKKPIERKYQEHETSITELPATVSTHPKLRPVPFYAMLDTFEQEDNGQLSRPVSMSSPIREGPRMPSVSPPEERQQPDLLAKQDKLSSMLLPSPPTLAAEFNATHTHPPSAHIPLRQPELAIDEPAASESSKPRTPRLQQVGRIPRVVSKRDRLHKPPPQSFSRPFVRQLASATEPLVHTTELEDSAPLTHSSHKEVFPSYAWGELESPRPPSSAAAIPNVKEMDDRTIQHEFLTFPCRQFSQVSGGSSSSGIASFPATKATTAIIPAPDSALDEDEVWNEYNDFLDTVSPAPLSEQSASTSDYLKKGGKMAPPPLHIRRESPPKPLSSPWRETATVHDLPQPPSMSRLLSPRHSGGEMISSPMSFSDFFAGYADRNRISAASKRQSYSSGSRYSEDSSPSRRSSGAHSKRHTQIMAERTDNAESQSNLRFSALMTSRWLSFGRVLFSPAHNEVQSNRQDRVLVLDGLGNDDWSFYCALTYPSATIYNLSATPKRSSASYWRKRDTDAYDSPPNHRQISHTSIVDPFPFPKAFFSAAVFRFPVASSEAAYASAISEFKRVLQPGGHLELSILDLDMVNMGNRARRAVRMLKVRMQVADPHISLKPNSDNIQKMLGRRGFENLKSCMVDVPVAGHISSSRVGSIDGENHSLGDMLKDSSTKGDESITKMVAKVGRWWYTRCYEMSVLPPGEAEMENSIWNDKQLLKECEKKETGLKLLICCAQKPETVKRRTMSA